MHLLPKLDKLPASFSVYLFGVFSVRWSIFLLSLQKTQITAVVSSLYMVSHMYEHSLQTVIQATSNTMLQCGSSYMEHLW